MTVLERRGSGGSVLHEEVSASNDEDIVRRRRRLDTPKDERDDIQGSQ
jgi:hypothetical protein